MNKLMKAGMVAWSALCFIGGAIVSVKILLRIPSQPSGHATNADTLELLMLWGICFLVWFFPTVAMGTIALVTRKKAL